MLIKTKKPNLFVDEDPYACDTLGFGTFVKYATMNECEAKILGLNPSKAYVYIHLNEEFVRIPIEDFREMVEFVNSAERIIKALEQ